MKIELKDILNSALKYVFYDENYSIEIELTDKQVEQFLKYYELLVEWNSFMNLTGITEYEEVVQIANITKKEYNNK